MKTWLPFSSNPCPPNKSVLLGNHMKKKNLITKLIEHLTTWQKIVALSMSASRCVRAAFANATN